MLQPIYVKMPITIDQKHEYHRQGFRVIDERFKPADAEDAPVEETEAERKARRAAERKAKKEAAAKEQESSAEDEE